MDEMIINTGRSDTPKPTPSDGEKLLRKFWTDDAKARKQQYGIRPEQYPDVIQALVDGEGWIERAAKALNLHRATIYRVMGKDGAFRDAVYAVQDMFRRHRLEKMEVISTDEALDPKNVRERIFQLGAHDPGKYRSKQQVGPTSINIQFGFQLPKFASTPVGKPVKDHLAEVDADYIDATGSQLRPETTLSEGLQAADDALEDVAGMLPALPGRKRKRKQGGVGRKGMHNE